MKISKDFCKVIIVMVSLMLLMSMTMAAENETGNQTIENNISEEINASEEVVIEDALVENLEEAGNTPEQMAEALCGNNAIDPGETCISCPQDVRCQSGQICNPDTEMCESQSDFTLYIVLGFLFIAILGFVIFRAIRKKKSKQEEKPVAQPQMQAKPSPAQGSIQADAQKNKSEPEQAQKQGSVPQEGANNGQATQKDMKGQQPAQKAAENQNKAQQPKQEAKKEEVQMPPETKNIQKGNDKDSKIQAYIEQMRSKGVDDEKIRQKLRNEGWNDNKIAIAFLTMKKK